MLGFLSAVPTAVKLLGVGVLVGVVTFAFVHYTTLKGELADAQARVGAMEVSTAVQRTTISKQQEAIEIWKRHTDHLQKTVDSMNQAREEATKEYNRVRGILEKHDLEKLAAKKPKLIEKRINSGTNRIIRMLNNASRGSVDESGKHRQTK